MRQEAAKRQEALGHRQGLPEPGAIDGPLAAESQPGQNRQNGERRPEREKERNSAEQCRWPEHPLVALPHHHLRVGQERIGVGTWTLSRTHLISIEPGRRRGRSRKRPPKGTIDAGSDRKAATITTSS